MRKGQTRNYFRWGDFSKFEEPYAICMQLRLRGAVSIKVEERYIAGCIGKKISIFVKNGNMVNDKELILDLDGHYFLLERYFIKTEKADVFKNEVEKAIENSRRDIINLINKNV